MFLLDTNVVSEQRNLRVDRADANVALWADSVDAVDLEVSAITVFDDHRRAARSGATRCRVKPYTRGRTGRCCPRSQGAFLSVGVAVAARSALFHVPDPRPIRNAPIAAAALVHRIILVTRSGHHQALRRDCWRARRHGERSNVKRVSRPPRQNQALCKAPFGLGLARLRRIY